MKLFYIDIKLSSHEEVRAVISKNGEILELTLNPTPHKGVCCRYRIGHSSLSPLSPDDVLDFFRTHLDDFTCSQFNHVLVRNIAYFVKRKADLKN